MNDAGTRLEIFLLLAVSRKTPVNSAEDSTGNLEKEDFPEKIFAALAAHLPTPEAAEFARLRADYERQSEAAQENWRRRVESSLGADEFLLDPRIHRSHIDRALQQETAAVGEIIRAGLPPEYRDGAERKQEKAADSKSRAGESLEKFVRETFAGQFVARQNLPAATAFDDLNGAQTARLIRLAGVREVALACVRITAVESVASFLRRFPAEDARAIAAQLNGLPKTADERLSFAENLVQTALEGELKPAAMLDLLGFRLIAIALAGAPPERIAYSEQKLPLEVEPKLSVTVETERRTTPVAMQREIGRQIEQLAVTVAKTGEKVKS